MPTIEPRAAIRSLIIRLSCLVSTFLLIQAAWAETPTPRELSALHLPIGEVVQSDFSPDGQFIIYQGYFELRDHLNVYSLPVAGGAGDEVLLGQRWGTLGSPRGHFGFSRDQTRVLFFTPDWRLVSVPIIGGEETTLFEAEPSTFIQGVHETPDGLLVFTAQPRGKTQRQAFAMPASGGSALQLSDLPGPGWTTAGVQVSEDGARVVYGAAISLTSELYSVPIGGGAPIKISHQLQAGQSIVVFRFSPDGATLAYEVTTPINANFFTSDLYSVPAAGGAATLLHDGWDGAGTSFQGTLGVTDFFFSADSSQILFPDSTPSQTELYSIPSSGGAKSLIDTQPWIRNYWWFPEASRLFYQWWNPNFSVGTLELGAGSGTQLSVHPQGNIGTSVQISPDLSRVAYNAKVLTGQRTDLFSVPTTGGAPVLLNDIQASQEDVLKVLATNTDVIFERDRRFVAVPIDGGLETFLTETIPHIPGDPMQPFPDGNELLYRAGFESPEVTELFKVSISGGPSETLSSPITEVQGWTSDHVLDATGTFAAYLSDQDQRLKFQLYETPTDAEGSSRLISPPLGDFEDVRPGLELASALNAVIYEINRSGPDGELWMTPFGGQPRRLLDLETVQHYELVDPGNKLLYLDEDGELWELDLGTGLSRSLEGHPSFILEFALSPDQTLILFETVEEFFSLPVAGGLPTPMGVRGSLFEISPDSSWAVVNDISSGVVLVATDGSSEIVFGPNTTIQEAFTADSQFLIYKRSLDDELWSYSIPGGSHRRLDAGADPEEYFIVDWWRLENDEILFSLTGAPGGVQRFFTVAAASGAPSSVLEPAIDDRLIVDSFLSSDRRRLIVDVTDGIFDPSALYSVSLSSGRAEPLDGAENARFLAFSPENHLVLYQEEDTHFSAPLLASPVDGGPAIALTPQGFGEAEDGARFYQGELLTLRFSRHLQRRDLYAIDLADFFLFSDGFESGDLAAWSSSAP